MEMHGQLQSQVALALVNEHPITLGGAAEPNCTLFVCFWRNSPPVGQGLLIYEVSRSHKRTHHSQ